MMNEAEHEYILYVKLACPYCRKAENVLIENNKTYVIIPFDKDPNTLEHMKWAYSHQTVPIIFHKSGSDIKLIGGYTELVDYMGENDEPEENPPG